MNISKIILLMGSFQLGSTLNCQIDNELQIKMLNADRLEKIEKLIELGKKLTDQENLISSIDQRLQELMSECRACIKDELESQKLNPEIIDHEIDNAFKAVNTELVDLWNAIRNNEAPEHVLSEMLLEAKNAQEAASARLKINSVRYNIEIILLSDWVREWEDCLRKIYEISNNIKCLNGNII